MSTDNNSSGHTYVELKIDSEFSSLVELEKSIEAYEVKNYCNFTKFSSRTIEGARKKGLLRYINPTLEYSAIDYMCVQGGQYKSKSKGLRPQQSSYRSNCPVYMRIRPNKTGEKLTVQSFISEHNHTCSKPMFEHYPKQRRLDNDAKIMATKLVNMKVNKKILQNDLMQTHDKITTLKDVVLSKKEKALNAHEKFKQAHIEARRLASLASEATGNKYEERLNLLKYIADLWEKDENITTTQIDELHETAVCDFLNVDLEDKAMCDLDMNVEKSDLEIIDCNLENLQEKTVDIIEQLPTLPTRTPKRGRPKGKDETDWSSKKKVKDLN